VSTIHIAPTAPYALVRRPAETLADGIVTFIVRQPIDLDLARKQWQEYVTALESHGWADRRGRRR
jgi:dimethylargininase